MTYAAEAVEHLKNCAQQVLTYHLYDDSMGGIKNTCEGLLDGSVSTETVSIDLIDALDFTVGVVVVTEEPRFNLVSVFIMPGMRKQGNGSMAVEYALNNQESARNPGEDRPWAYQIGCEGSEVFWSKIKKNNPEFIIDELKNYY